MESLKIISIGNDNEKVVREHIEALGAEEFQFASKRLRSDAEFILSLVEKFPKVLKFADKHIYDRVTIVDGKSQEIDVSNNVLFASECFDRNKNTFKYFSDDLAVAYYNMVKAGFVEEGYLLSYRIRWIGNGKNCEQALKELEALRPGIASLAEIAQGLNA